MPAVSLLDRVRARAGASPYLSRVGFALEEAGAGRARAALHSRAQNTNRNGSVHGGAIASVLLAAAEIAAASEDRGADACDVFAADLAVSFLRPVRDGVAPVDARVDVRGRDVAQTTAELSADGRACARAQASFRFAPDEAGGFAVRSRAALENDSADLGTLAGSAYMGSARARIRTSDGEWSRMSMPLEPNTDGGARVHAGAIAGLVDTCGARASHAHAGARTHGGGATVAMSIAYALPANGDLEGAGRLIGSQGSRFVVEVEIWLAKTGMVCASGLVSYRIPTDV